MRKNLQVEYQITETIAQGGTATVFKAKQISLNRWVAIKKLHPHLGREKEFVARFEIEARAIANLKHPAIVDIYDFGQDEDGSYFTVMEYIDGYDLDFYVHQYQFLPAEIAALVVKEVLSALVYAHQRKIIHRDIKPANIMLTQDGEVKLMDFGIAQVNTAFLTEPGKIVGTPLFMSPQQAEGKKVDEQTDIYSLGVVFYYLLAGQYPYQGENSSVILHQIIYNPPRPLGKLAPFLDSKIISLVEKAIEKDLTKRYQTATLFLSALEQWLKNQKLEQERSLLKKFVQNPKKLIAEKREIQFQAFFENGMKWFRKKNLKLAWEELEKARKIKPTEEKIIPWLRKIEKQLHPQQTQATEVLIRSKKYEQILGLVGILVFLSFIFWSSHQTPSPPSSSFILPKMPPVKTETNVSHLLPGEEEVSPPTTTTPEKKIKGVKKPHGGQRRKKSSSIQTRKKKKPAYGFLRVFSEPWAEIYIDGRKVGTAPVDKSIILTPGSHQLWLKNPSGLEYKEKIFIRENEEVIISVTLKEREK
jgi:serine/threonine protein kinase